MKFLVMPLLAVLCVAGEAKAGSCAQDYQACENVRPERFCVWQLTLCRQDWYRGYDSPCKKYQPNSHDQNICLESEAAHQEFMNHTIESLKKEYIDVLVGDKRR